VTSVRIALGGRAPAAYIAGSMSEHPPYVNGLESMKRILGMGVGAVYLGIAWVTYTKADAGWDAGHADLGFWWTVVTAFLTIAALSALIGTWIHTQGTRS